MHLALQQASSWNGQARPFTWSSGRQNADVSEGWKEGGRSSNLWPTLRVIQNHNAIWDMILLGKTLNHKAKFPIFVAETAKSSLQK